MKSMSSEVSKLAKQLDWPDGPKPLLAIDPGLTGAIAVYSHTTGKLTVSDMPIAGGEVDAHALYDLISACGASLAFLEQVGPMPRDGVKQAWRFSAAFTTAKLCVQLNKIRLITVTAPVWKKALHLPGGAKNKDKSRARAITMFPHNSNDFRRKMDSGRAEAALLAYYAATIGTAQLELPLDKDGKPDKTFSRQSLRDMGM